jgi:hypothetical protein
MNIDDDDMPLSVASTGKNTARSIQLWLESLRRRCWIGRGPGRLVPIRELWMKIGIDGAGTFVHLSLMLINAMLPNSQNIVWPLAFCINRLKVERSTQDNYRTLSLAFGTVLSILNDMEGTDITIVGSNYKVSFELEL